MLNLFNQLAKTANQTSGGNDPDFLDYPKNYRDERIYEYDGGYDSKCWIWRNPATVDQAKLTARLDSKKQPPKPGWGLLNSCGYLNCIRKTHLVLVNDEVLADVENLRRQCHGSTREELAPHHEKLDEVCSRIRSWISGDSKECEKSIARSERTLATLLNVSLSDLQWALRPPTPQNRSQAVAQSPGATATGAFATARSEANTTTASASSPMPPLPPFPPAPSGPLGNPTGLAARPCLAANEIMLIWTPAANAMGHYCFVWMEGSDSAQALGQGLPGDCREFTVRKPAGDERCWFIVIAAQQPSEGGSVVWSEWSNWAAFHPPE